MGVQSDFYSTDGQNKTFPSTKHIATKQHMAVWLRQKLDIAEVQLDPSKYELITNAAVFNSSPSTILYDRIEIRVADSLDELTSSPSAISVVAGIAEKVVTVAGIESEVVTVAGDTAQINLIADDLAKGIGTNQPTDSAILNALTNAAQTQDDVVLAAISADESAASAASVNNPAQTMTELLTFYTSVGYVNVLGYYSINDGGGGLFNYDATIDKSTANAGTIIDPSVSLDLQGTGVGLGCWVRQYSGAVNVKWFGAYGTGSNTTSIEDTRAFINAIAYLSTFTTGGVLDISAGYYYINETLTINHRGIALIGAGQFATTLFFNNATGHGIRFKQKECTVKGLTVSSKGARLAVATVEVTASGIVFEAEDIVEDTTTRMQRSWVEDVNTISQPGHGVAMIGPALSGSRIQRVTSTNNNAHGIVVDRGMAIDRVNLPTVGIPGLINIMNCNLEDNGGYGLAIGYHDDTFSTPALRVVAENIECESNATNGSALYSVGVHQMYVRGSNNEVRASICTTGSGTGGGIWVAGRNHWFRNNRFINVAKSFTVGTHTALPTQGINIEGMTVLDQVQTVAVVVEASAQGIAEGISITNVNMSNIIQLITHFQKDTKINLPMQTHIITNNTIVNNSTAFITADDLKFYVGANEAYNFRFVFFYTGDAASDMRTTITQPASPTLFRYSFGGGVRYASNDLVAGDTTKTVGGETMTIGATSDVRMGVIEGVVEADANAGFVEFQFAQLAATVSDTIILARSFVEYTRVDSVIVL